MGEDAKLERGEWPVNGRIPVEAFMGAGKAMAAAKARQRERLMKGGRCFLTSAALTLDDTVAEMSLAFRGLFRRGAGRS